jgi:hypothetical protein
MGFQTDSATSAPPPPPPPATYPSSPSPLKLSTKGTRLSASTLMLIAAILLAVSMGVSWWGASVTGAGPSVTLGLMPGSSYTGTSGSTTTTTTYASSTLIHVGQLYEAILGVGLLAVFAGFAAMLMSYIGAFGVFKSRGFLRITLLLTIITFVSAALLPGLAALGQPAAFNADGQSGFAGTGGGCGPTPNPCTSFWGTYSATGVKASWGADVGWYLSLAAAVLLLIALLQLLMTRRQPYTHDEVWVASPHPAPSPPPPAWNPPSAPATPPAAGAPPGTPQQTSAYCPRCGNPMTYITQYSRWYCMTERVYL